MLAPGTRMPTVSAVMRSLIQGTAGGAQQKSDDRPMLLAKVLRSDTSATLRRVATVGGIPTKQLFTLFPKKPAKKMAYIAGLPKPRGCV